MDTIIVANPTPAVKPLTARLHNFTDAAIAAIMTRHSQPQRFGRSRQNVEAVRVIHEQFAIDRREQNDLLTAALIEASPELADARRVALDIRKSNGWTASDTDHAVNGLKRWLRASRLAASGELSSTLTAAAAYRAHLFSDCQSCAGGHWCPILDRLDYLAAREASRGR